MEESVTTHGIFQSILAVLGDGDCLTSYAGGWGLPHQLHVCWGVGTGLTSYAGGWGLASPAMLRDGDCLTSYAGGWGLLSDVPTQTNSH